MDAATCLGAISNAALKFATEKKSEPVPADAVEISKIQSADNSLGDPEQRAESDQGRICAQHEVKNTLEADFSPGWRSPLDEQFRAAPRQLELQIVQRKRARRPPLRAQLRVKAQMRAHALRIASLPRHVQALQLREALRPPGATSDDDEFEIVWEGSDQVSESAETVNEDSAQREEEEEEERKAIARQAAEKEAKLREEEAAREQAAAEQEREKEVEWIIQEAKESILILAGMGERPKTPLAVGYAQMLHDDYVRRLLEKTDDLLDYLWDKAHSGDWICPEIKDALDLDQLLGPVLQLEAPDSYFPSTTQELAASLLRKWRGEDSDETDDCDETDDTNSPAGETTPQPGSSSVSSAGGSEAEGQLASVDLQFCPQAAEPQQSPFSKNTHKTSSFAQDVQQPSPFAQETPQQSPFVQGTQQQSPFAKKTQQKSPFARDQQQHNNGTQVSLAGCKRVRSSNSYEARENQRPKRQKQAGLFELLTEAVAISCEE